MSTYPVVASAMSNRRIAIVGFELATDDVHELRLTAKDSLLDFDIVMFRPDFQGLGFDGEEHYQGKPSLSDNASFRFKECCEHWRREIREIIDAGKTAIVFLSEMKEVFVATGTRSHSGTGRNRATTRHVEIYNNFRALPVSLSAVSATGKEMKLAPRGAEILSTYWSEFHGESTYKIVIADKDVQGAILTRNGDKPVGAIVRSKKAAGSLLLLPDIDFLPDEFTTVKGNEVLWTAAAKKFAARFLASVVALDKTLRSSGEKTPPPSWAASTQYSLKREEDLQAQLLEAELELETIVKKKEALQDTLVSAGNFRALLYEKGKPLEAAIVEALRVLGFTASPYKDSESEFDVVFESLEGRLIGEAEGKDNKAINVDKLRQLAMNIHEDLLRPQVTRPAKPVLFGNAFRLERPESRGQPFTDKCVSAAGASSTALVSTPELFTAIQYLLDCPDDDYARACRMKILSSIGMTEFPPPPSIPPAPATALSSA